MIFPNKVVRYENSIFPKLALVLEKIQYQDMRPIELYNKLRTNFEDINQFIVVLNVLFVLGKIKLDDKAGILSYVNSNKLQ